VQAKESFSQGIDSNFVSLNSASWLNKPFPLFNEIDGGAQLRTGRWFLMFYHHDCDRCHEAISIYSFWALTASSDKAQPGLAFIAIPPSAPAGEDPVVPSSSYLHLHLRPNHNWIATTPVVVAIEEGKVLVVVDGANAIKPPVVPW